VCVCVCVLCHGVCVCVCRYLGTVLSHIKYMDTNREKGLFCFFAIG
jgi:hypothetical protein